MREVRCLPAAWLIVLTMLLLAHQPADAAAPVAAPRPPAAADNRPARTVEQLAAAALDSVVVVSYEGRDGKPAGVGSGFIISDDGLIATNLHVIGDARPITVQTADGKTFGVVEVHATDRTADLAILRIDNKSLAPLVLGDSDQVRQGEAIVALGNPRGLKHSVVAGVISGTREIDGKNMLQVAIPIEAGNSGGPVLDEQGRVVGLVTLKSLVTDNLGFAVPVNALKPLIEKPNPVPMSRWLTIGTLNPRDWTPLFGAQWRQRAGQIQVSGRGGGIGARSIVLSTVETPDLPFEVAVTLHIDQDDGAAGLVFHSDGNEKHYGFYPSNGRLRLSRFDGADVFQWQVLEEVGSKHFQPGEWNRLKVRVDENVIQCFVNGELVIESHDARYGSGRVGLAKFRHTSAQFKRFQVARNIPSPRPDAAAVELITSIAEEVTANRPPRPELVARLLPHSAGSGYVLRREAKQLEQRAQRLRQLARAVQQEATRRQLAAELKKEEDEIDLIRAALLIAAIDNEEIDVGAYVRHVEQMADELSATFDKTADEATRLKSLNNYLFDELGFHGSRTNYYHQSNSYLNEVIDDREGLPILLSVLYMDMARRIGLQVVGVGLPGHFIVRHEPQEGEPQLIDPFDRGRVWTDEEARRQIKSRVPGPLDERFLKAQPKRAILTRMLRNLMGIAGGKEDAEALLAYVNTVLVIEPDSAEDRWFRAVLHYQTGRLDEAIEDTNRLLEDQPDGIDLRRVRKLQRVILRARDERLQEE